MKRCLLFSTLALALITLSSSQAQSPSIPPDVEQQIIALVREIKTQQTQIRDNQEKIDAKMAEVTETVRVARLFAGKAGK